MGAIDFVDSRWFSFWFRWCVLVPACCVMVINYFMLQTWGIGTFAASDRSLEWVRAQGSFEHSVFFDAEGKFTLLRYARSPGARFLHILPTALWSTLLPFQVSPSFRSKHPVAHRRMGRVMIFASVSMALGVPFFIFDNVTKAAYGIVHGGSMLALSAYFLVTALLAIYHARNRNFSVHRVWALRHVALGYSVHLQRLVMSFTQPFMYKLLPGFDDHTNAGSDLRSLVFALYFWCTMVFSFVCMEIWLGHTRTSNGRATTHEKSH